MRLIFPGYLDPAAGSTYNRDNDGWFRTGDIGRLDADGNLHHIGRARISPAEIELLLVQRKVPTTVRIVTASELPLTATGKVSKRLLREDAQARLLTGTAA